MLILKLYQKILLHQLNKISYDQSNFTDNLVIPNYIFVQKNNLNTATVLWD
jgi:hypothetical protein